VPEKVRVMIRARARVRILGRFDGAAAATVTITGGAEPLIMVRPLRRRRSFTLPLVDVARGVIFDVTRAELTQKRRAVKGRR
jgi:hypothetical protein